MTVLKNQLKSIKKKTGEGGEDNCYVRPKFRGKAGAVDKVKQLQRPREGQVFGHITSAVSCSTSVTSKQLFLWA